MKNSTSIVFNEDCMEVMKRYPDNHFDLAIVDPPYGIGMDSWKKRTKPSRPNSYNYKPKYKDGGWDSETPDQKYFDELFRVSNHQIIWGANYMCASMPPNYGWIFWHKKNGENNCFSDGEFAFSSFGVQSRFVSISQFHGTNGGQDRIHPTQKPVKLYDWLIKNYATDCKNILDTHLGSGSSRIAAYKAGIDFVGCELDKEYFDAQEKRFNEFKSQLTLF